MIIEKLNLKISKYYPMGAVRKMKEEYGNKKVKAIEIGVYKGKHAKSMLKELNIKELVLIDPYKDYKIVYGREELKKDYEGLRLLEAKNEAEKRLKKNKNIMWIYEESDKAIRKIKGKYDFVYIDGDHSYEQTKKDIENYYQITKENGIISGDDIDQPQVFKAVSEFSIKENKEVIIWGLNWIIKK